MNHILLLEDIPEIRAWLKALVKQVFANAQITECSRVQDALSLVNGQRSQDELYYHQEFEELAARHPHFRYLPVLSHEPADSGWPGARGFAHEAAVAAFGNDFRGCKAYLCGPPAMIEACISALMQGRLFERDIYTEKFLSAADAQQLRSPLFRAL